MPAEALRINMPLQKLKEYLQKLSDGGIALAFSGGVDSTLLLAVLGEMNKEKPFPLAALTMHTVLQNDSEIAAARDMCQKFGVRQEIFSFNPFSLPEVKNNRTDRCYHCKKAIFTRFCEFAAQEKLQYLLDGTNADDLSVYRPGRKALQELGVLSPLAELHIDKRQIREMSAALGLPTASKPAVPCLATRFEYNTLLDDDKIKNVAAAEAWLHQTFPQIRDIRLRIHGNLARLEVSRQAIPDIAAQAERIAEELKRLGFQYITLDLEGFRSGSFDTGLK